MCIKSYKTGFRSLIIAKTKDEVFFIKSYKFYKLSNQMTMLLATRKKLKIKD